MFVDIWLYTDTKKGQYWLKVMQGRLLQCETVDIYGKFYEKIR